MPTLDVWYDQLDADVLLKMVRQQVRLKQLDKKSARRAEKHLAEAYTRDSTRAFARLASRLGGELRIIADPPLITPIEDLIVPGTEWQDLAPLIIKLLATYRRTLDHQGHPLEDFHYVTPPARWSDVGSVGTRCYIVLLIGRDNDDPLFLQVKEAQVSVLEPYAGGSTFPHHGQRVVTGQRLMQAASDIFLGWQRIKGLDGGPVTTTCASSRTGRAPRSSNDCPCPAPRPTRGCAGRRWPGRTPARATGSRSPPTWATATPSTGPSPSSPPPTPTKMNVTTSPRGAVNSGRLTHKPACRCGRGTALASRYAVGDNRIPIILDTGATSSL